MSAWPAIRFTQEPSELAGFVAYLKQIRFPHRVTEEPDGLLLWVFDQSHITWVQQQYEQWLQGNLQLPEAAYGSKRSLVNWPMLWQRYPITISLALLSIVGFLAVVLNSFTLVSLLSFQGFSPSVDGMDLVINSHEEWLELMRQGQWWRLFTPMFLHFSLMHLAFNMVLLWYFGKQLEHTKGRYYFISLVLAMSLLSNSAQYLSSNNLFGGMSGVDYGLIAYCAVANYKHRSNVYHYPQGLFWFALISMALGFTGVFSLLGLQLANWAHLVGFASGAVLALLSDKSKS